MVVVFRNDSFTNESNIYILYILLLQINNFITVTIFNIIIHTYYCWMIALLDDLDWIAI